ncbi:hypothetical protein RhiirA1_484853 [Rhizophagus irregularis]|uniref:Uncharacterized protein n=1 Tax=Rhizophagus irregularis TaxID=588596 RepID=A0A2N0QIV5_9GLOM|nr:hypothetical protein RhiirA1_484853 [Rhizophagus irregularis]
MEPPGGLVIGNMLILRSYHAWKSDFEERRLNRFGQVLGRKNTFLEAYSSGKMPRRFPPIHQEKYFIFVS